MPKPLKNTETSFAEQLSAHMAKLGAKGGKVSGARRMENLSAAKRRSIAKAAAAARWAKQRGTQA